MAFKTHIRETLNLLTWVKCPLYYTVMCILITVRLLSAQAYVFWSSSPNLHLVSKILLCVKTNWKYSKILRRCKLSTRWQHPFWICIEAFWVLALNSVTKPKFFTSTSSSATTRHLSERVFFKENIAVPIFFKWHLWNLCSPSGCCAMTVTVMCYFRRIFITFFRSWVPRYCECPRLRLHRNCQSTAFIRATKGTKVQFKREWADQYFLIIFTLYKNVSF